ncbi:MAG: F0F1 ATP synthase subunit epsilon [Gammaproteobacteria bacterium]|jgi:F-type H+-transporting ATPase subunit epsilon
MAMTVQVDIVSAEEAIFSGQAEMVYAPAAMGEVGVAPRHAPMLTPLKPGSVRIQTGSEEKIYYVSGGLLEVQPNTVTVLADTVVRARDLDEAAAEKARAQAEERIRDHKDEFDFAAAQTELAEAMAQLATIDKLKHKAQARH